MKSFSFAAVSLVILNLIAASPVAAAGASGIVHISATVLPSATITTSQLATTTSWTGSNREALPFNVTVASSDLAGYTFTVTGTNATSGQFTLAGSAGNAVRPTYTVTGSRQDETYTDGVPGTTVYAGPANDAETTFAVNLPVLANVTPDTYTDTLVVTVNVR